MGLRVRWRWGLPFRKGVLATPGTIPQAALARADWLKQQTVLINHYGLNVMDPQARQYLTRNMEAFLFKAGQGDVVDTTKQGTISH